MSEANWAESGYLVGFASGLSEAKVTGKSTRYYIIKGIFLNLVFAVNLEVLMFLQYSIAHHSVERHGAIFFSEKNFGQFSWKKAEVFGIFSNRFYISHCPLSFLTLTLIFNDRIFRIPLLITQLRWQKNDPSRSFRWPKLLCMRVFIKTTQSEGFSQGKCYFEGLLCPNITDWHPNAGYRMEPEAVVAFSSLTKNFWFFKKILFESLMGKRVFPINLCII